MGSERVQNAANMDDGSMPSTGVGGHEGFVVTKINGVFFYSRCVLPQWMVEQFVQWVDYMKAELTWRNPVDGDFNDWADQ